MLDLLVLDFFNLPCLVNWQSINRVTLGLLWHPNFLDKMICIVKFALKAQSTKLKIFD